MNFNKTMVALDLSKMDETLIQYTTFIVQMGEVKTVEFVHVIPSYGPPMANRDNLEIITGKELPQKERTMKRLAERVQSAFDKMKGVEFKLSVLDGKPQDELLLTVQKTKPNLLVLGKKQISDGSGVNARRVARKVEAAIWFVTEGAKAEIQNILVPVDFSDNSFRALKSALDLRKQLKDVTITALHVIDVPMTAYKINRNKDEIIAEMKASATNRFLNFLSHNQIDRTGINFLLVMNDEFDVARYIQKKAAKEKADLIIIGGKGNSMLDNLLFGSVTEKLVTYEYETPILVVR